VDWAWFVWVEWFFTDQRRSVLRRATDMIKTMNAANMCIAILLATALSACATKLGRNFDDAYAQQIKPGETTKAQVREKLGRPAGLLRMSGDEEIWTYAYYEGRGALGYMFGTVDPEFGQQGSQKRLTVSFKGESVKESKFLVELPRSER
jgi:outer membrane protein assembly factor BamE (lipoprotein component of BamABCDE complex)